MTQQEYNERMDGLIAPIKRFYHINPIVQEIARQYGAGHILTKEEALYRMVAQQGEVIEKLMQEETYRMKTSTHS